MRRLMTALGIVLLATALTAGIAGAAPARKTGTAGTTHTGATTNGVHWYAVAGVRQTETSAKELMAKLEAKRFEGFGIRARMVRHGTHRVRRFFVERMFPDRRATETEVKQLREAGFRGWVAHQRG